MKEKKIKKEIKFSNLTIKLYKVEESWLLESAVSNIEAFDYKGNLFWTIEKPTFSSSYFDMQIDEENGFLEAADGGGRKYEINLSNGRIIKSNLVK